MASAEGPSSTIRPIQMSVEAMHYEFLEVYSKYKRINAINAASLGKYKSLIKANKSYSNHKMLIKNQESLKEKVQRTTRQLACVRRYQEENGNLFDNTDLIVLKSTMTSLGVILNNE